MKKIKIALVWMLAFSAQALAQTNPQPPTAIGTAQVQSLQPSPGWGRAMPPGPDARVKITEEYARQVGRDAYFWAWPMVNIYNRRLHFMQVKEIMRQGPLMEAPANRLAMLTDYVDPDERSVACPNQDVVYGIGALALDISPVVVQVPDFGDRFWVYQVVDLRTDSFVQIGKMYGTAPGFYLLVGPNWNGDVPKGITRVFHASSNTGIVVPRVAQNDTPEDKRAIQSVLPGIMMYPVSEYDGRMKTKDWANLPKRRHLRAAKRKRSGCFRRSSSTSCRSPRNEPMGANNEVSCFCSATARVHQHCVCAERALYVRAYWPKAEIMEGSWTPPAVRPADGAKIGVKQ